MDGKMAEFKWHAATLTPTGHTSMSYLESTILSELILKQGEK